MSSEISIDLFKVARFTNLVILILAVAISPIITINLNGVLLHLLMR